MAMNKDRTACDLHRREVPVRTVMNNSFPRVYADAEEREWVTEA